MPEASIPVDLFSPGQVLACLGFLEAAEALLGDAEAGFDWSDESAVRFRLKAGADANPFEVVLQFLADAELTQLAPGGYVAPLQRKKKAPEDGGEGDDEARGAAPVVESDSFPGKEVDRLRLPLRLSASSGRDLELGHWADGSSRHDFKLYAGDRSAHAIATTMLLGVRGKPTKKCPGGVRERAGVRDIWQDRRDELLANPLGVVTLMGGSFNFDPRGGWTGVDAGYSPNRQGNHGVAASPVLEMLAALGLEHARPARIPGVTLGYRYAAWGEVLPPSLARAVFGLAPIAVPRRCFGFVLGWAGKNKFVTFAQEETLP